MRRFLTRGRRLEDYVGAAAEQHVSKLEAALMAKRAFRRAVELNDPGESQNHVIGLSCTAAIATDRLRRGEEPSAHRMARRRSDFDDLDSVEERSA